MRTGREVFEQAMYLLNYTDGNGRLDGRQYAELFRRALPLVNQIYSDLCFAGGRDFSPLSRMEQEIKLPARLLHDVMPYGVAMLLSQSESDGDNQQLFAGLYDQKRAALCQSTRRVDTLPIAEAGWTD